MRLDHLHASEAVREADCTLFKQGGWRVLLFHFLRRVFWGSMHGHLSHLSVSDERGVLVNVYPSIWLPARLLSLREGFVMEHDTLVHLCTLDCLATQFEVVSCDRSVLFSLRELRTPRNSGDMHWIPSWSQMRASCLSAQCPASASRPSCRCPRFYSSCELQLCSCCSPP